MKISEFKITKKLIFTDGEGKIEVNNLEDKVIEFNELNYKLLTRINEEVMSTMTGDEPESLFLYKILPYLTDIEVDISYEEFDDMTKLPSKEFCQLCEFVIDEMNLIIETSKTISQLNKKSDSINKKANKMIHK